MARFKPIFISYDVLAKGFMKGCSWFIGIDSCHLKTRFGGVSLLAVSMEANNGIYSLATTVSETENKDS